MNRPIYLDYQATTPLAPESRAAMEPWLGDKFGNPHSPHRLGREAAAAVEAARGQVLAALQSRSSRAQSRGAGIDCDKRPSTALGTSGIENGQLIFTSGATEAANLALKGAAGGAAERRKVVTLATEHACVLDTVSWLGRTGFEVVMLPVGDDGLVDLEHLAGAIDERTAIVAAMLVNNEIGIIQPIGDIAHMAREAGALFFCDAVQGFGRTELPDADLIAVSAHKVHGPKGIGALWVRDGVRLEPLMHGGGQEADIRSGTLSPALCAGFGAAAALAERRFDEDHAHMERLWALATDRLSDWTVNGSIEKRYRGNLNVRLPGLDAARLISDARAVAFSAGSACASGSGRPSHVLKAIGLSDAEARSSIRLGFGRYTTENELNTALDLILEAADRQKGVRVTQVRFISADGARISEANGAPGDRLLDVAQADGQPLEGTCEGQMACSTCHVIVDPADFAKLPPASEPEEDMLDLATGATRYSRLACQVFLGPDLESLTVRIPAEARNMQGR